MRPRKKSLIYIYITTSREKQAIKGRGRTQDLMELGKMRRVECFITEHAVNRKELHGFKFFSLALWNNMRYVIL